MSTISRFVGNGARSCEAKCTGTDCICCDRSHLCNLIWCRSLGMIGAAISHDIATNRSVTNLCGKVDGMRSAVDAVEVLGERFPIPCDSLMKGSPGNVFDSFHDLDKPVMSIRGDWRETHATISHDRSGDSLPRRWREVGIPTHLTVIVGMDVDPPRSNKKSGCVELRDASLVDVADGGNNAVIDGEITEKSRTASAVDDGPIADDEIVLGHVMRVLIVPVACA